jgi:ABC-type branched-subunit amino acid transport system substrate-binding protein
VKRRHKPAITAALAVAVMGAIVSACTSGTAASTSAQSAPPAATGSGNTTGITAKTITIGQITTTSGPIPGLFQGANDGLDAFAAYVNSRGGVDGRTLRVIHDDDGLDCNTYQQELRSLTQQAFAVVGSYSVEDGCGTPVLAANPGFADIQGTLLNPTMYAVPNAFSPSPWPPGFPTTDAIWLKQEFPSAITHVAALWETSAPWAFPEFSSAWKAEGFDYVYSRGIGPAETNFTSDVLRMKAAGVQIVDLRYLVVSQAVDFIAEADQQGFHPDAIVSAATYDSSFFTLLGSANADNVYMPLLFPMYLGQDEATNPALATFLQWLDKVHPGDARTLYGVVAWAAGQLFAQAADTLGADPTRAGLLAALHKITSFSADGLLPAADPGQDGGPVCMVIVGVQGRSFVRVDPPVKGYECDGAYHTIPLSQATG